MSDELSRLAQLRAAVATHNEAYFTHDSPTIPDADYDEMVLELRGLETRYGVSDDALTTTAHSELNSPGDTWHRSFARISGLRRVGVLASRVTLPREETGVQ